MSDTLSIDRKPQSQEIELGKGESMSLHQEEQMNAKERQARIEAIGDQLRAKISNKFQTTAFLAGLNFAVLGLQISLLWQQDVPRLLPLSISFTFIAILLYIDAVMKFDGLTMPKRFWEEDEQSEDGHIDPLAYLVKDLRELKERMQYYWNFLTVVATVITILSLYLMLLPLPSLSHTQAPEFTRTTFLLTTTVVFLVLIYFRMLYLVAKKRFNPLV